MSIPMFLTVKLEVNSILPQAFTIIRISEMNIESVLLCIVHKFLDYVCSQMTESESYEDIFGTHIYLLICGLDMGIINGAHKKCHRK